METQEIPDWLQANNQPPLTTDDVCAAWMRLIKTKVHGRVIELQCHGGDGYHIVATIDQVIPILGVGIALKIRDASIVAQQNQEADFNYPRTALPEARYVFLGIPDFPPEFRDHLIVLPAGGDCLDQSWETSFGGCLCIAFIFL